ncbi:MAG: helix-turn-helix domain-containing protein [Candidatus Pacebacteria bacterium]|nr:helix-turn-helix domain-containing protein [Candidatus Paceibacterota bacterium]NUQ57514.1 helix-turn-helix domain-containing protein [Candidatus Paceibacter sp.]
MIKLPDFIIIPYQLLEDKEISLIDERLYGVIYWFTKLKNEKCTANNQTLAELIKATTGTVGNSLTKLEKLGYIKRIFKGKQKKVRKEIIPLVVFTKVSSTNDTSVNVSSINDTVSSTNDTQVSSTNEQNKNKDNKNNKEYIARASLAPWNFKTYLEGMDNNQRRDLQIIALYWKFKKFTFTNRKQAEVELRRSLRAAKELEPYEDDKIWQTMDWLVKNADFKWTLESCGKYINEKLSALKTK